MRRQLTTCDSKVCSRCKRFMPFSNFYRSSDKANGYKSACRDCQKESMRALYQSPEGRKYRQEKSWRENGIVGMTVELYEQMLEAQGGMCALCDATANENGSRLCVDHDHKTGAIRGLLCHNCNTTLGRVDDDAERLRKAALYLERHSSKVVV